MTKPTSNIQAKIARHPYHVQVGIAAYQEALKQRKDWHEAVAKAIDAAMVVNGAMMEGTNA
jgi:hypothetical protein